MMFALGLLLLVILTKASGKDNSSSPRHIIPNELGRPPLEVIARYDFTRDSCFNETFPNLNRLTSQLELHRNNDTTSCSYGLGVESRVSLSSLVVSTSSTVSSTTRLDTNGKTIQDLFQPYQNSKQGITLELWLKPWDGDDKDNQLRPIVTFGSSKRSGNNHVGGTSNDVLTECDEQQLDLQIAQRGSIVEVIYRTSETIFEPCTRFRLVSFPLWEGRINHVVVALGVNMQQFFINGQPSPVLDEQFDGDLNHWDDQDEIFLFSYPKRDAAWNGRLYQLVLYNGFWSQALFDRSNLARTFPISQPYGIPASITINEDGELNPESHDAEWYRQEPIYEKGLVPEIRLTRSFVNHDIYVFLDALGVLQDPPRSLLTYITRLPSRGTLYQVIDGLPLNNISGTLMAVEGDSIAFLPIHNEYSMLPGATYASFDYCVADHEIFETWECDSATISIAVNPVNDPPLPLAFPDVLTVNEGIEHNNDDTLELSGSDVDSEDFVERIQITLNPERGHLVLSVSSFRDDGLLHGTPISVLNNVIPGPFAFVEYRFDGASQVVQHGKVKDAFRFRVSDQDGAWSSEITVSIHVEPSVVGHAQPAVTILEDSLGVIVLHGADESGLRREIGYFIESTPSDDEGILFDTSETRLSKDSMVGITEAYPYRHGASLVFQPSPDFCTVNSTLESVFRYRVAALADAKVASISNAMVQALIVQCQKDPIYLVGPRTIYHVEPFVEARGDPCSGYVFNASEVQSDTCATAAVVTGIQLTSRDTHSMPAYVSISAAQGLLTLNRNYWDDIVPLEGQEEARGSIRFLAQTHKLNDILSYLHFQSDIPGNDAIDLVIHYGTCNFTEIDLQNTKTGSGCQVVSLSISVVVANPPRRSGDSYLFRGFQWIPLPFTMLMLLLIKFKGITREQKSKQGGEGFECHGYQVEEIEIVQKEEICRNELSPEKSCGSEDGKPYDVPETLEYLWVQHCDDESGHYFYQNVVDGSVTWEAPSDVASVCFAK
jgi:hypothetical protein